ncbi:MAG: 3' terminal RNA ribose 2'-O-methyltransferase Hen1 [Myxococcales bacterium]|nr:3' terminal RNA ribose 2'-O-methyltransferase Hen1 [Myxococcales bacterium]
MLVTLTTTHRPATDLGYLLRKNPARAQSFSLTFGEAHVIWPEATDERATMALLVELDPVALVRGKVGSPSGGPLAMYVNDRPYTASSFLSVALGKVLRSALNGSAPERPELVSTPLPLQIEVAAVRSRGGPALLSRLFEPLGYAVQIEPLPTDDEPWEQGALFRLRLQGEQTVQHALQHLYVLLPVLDDDKHYWVGPAEVDKLMDKAGDWLGEHPESRLVAKRYLKHRGGLTRQALTQLGVIDDDDAPQRGGEREAEMERPLKLNDVRMARVAEVLERSGATRVVDLGCGEGKLVRRLLSRRQFTEIVGADVSAVSLDRAERRVTGDGGPSDAPERVRWLHSSATYRDPRLDGYDAIAMVEVIEHIDAERLQAVVHNVLAGARPRLWVITTPNAEYNVRFESLPAGRFRHADHRFEWTRAEFEAWATAAAQAHGYSVTFESIGPSDEAVGAPTQMALLRVMA